MQEIVQYLSENEDILEKIKNGSAELIGVTEIEKEAILNVFFSVKHSVDQFWM